MRDAGAPQFGVDPSLGSGAHAPRNLARRAVVPARHRSSLERVPRQPMAVARLRTEADGAGLMPRLRAALSAGGFRFKRHLAATNLRRMVSHSGQSRSASRIPLRRTGFDQNGDG